MSYQETAGWWPSTTANSNSNIYDLSMGSSYLNPQSNGVKDDGFSLRFIFSRRYPLSYVYSGNYGWYGSLYGQGSIGYWNSTTANGASNTYHFSIDNGSADPRDTHNKIYGWTLRCVFLFTKYPSVSAFVCILRHLRLGLW